MATDHDFKIKNGAQVENGFLLIGKEALSGSEGYMGMKTSNMTGTNDYMIVSGTGDNSTYISAKDGAYVYIRGGGNSSTHQLRIGSSNAQFYGNLQIDGNLTVNGTTLTVDTTNLQVQDNNITLNYGTGDTSSTANGAGITIQDAVNSTTNATIEWSQAGGNFNVSHGWNSLGYLQHSGVLYSRNNLLVLNSAGNGWNTWATRSNGQFNLSVGTISSGAITSSGNVTLSGTGNKDVYLGVSGSTEAAYISRYNDDFYLMNKDSGDLIFGTNNANKGRFTSSGDFQIGTTTVIDSSRNLTNIGTITNSGDITTSGIIKAHRSNSNVAAPNTANHAQGTRISFYDAGATAWYAMGIESNTLWFNSDANYKWYQDATLRMSLTETHLVMGTAGTTGLSGNSIRADGQIDTANVTTGTFRVYDGSTFRGGWGTGQWASGDTGEVANMSLYAVNKLNFHSNNTNTPQVSLTSSGLNSTVPYQISGTTVIDSSRNLTNIGTYSGAGDVVAQAANVMFHARSSADSQTVGYRAGYQNHTSLQAFFRYTTGDAQLYIDNDFTGNNGVYSNINFRNKANGGSSLINRMTIHGSTGNVNITGGALQMGGTTAMDANRQIYAKTGTQVGEDGTYSGYGVIGFGGITNGYNRVFGRDDTDDGLYLAAGTGNKVMVRANGSASNAFMLGYDDSYSGYVSLGFGGSLQNGSNRIFAGAGTSDGMYINAATGRGIFFRVNGTGSNVFQIKSDGGLYVGASTGTLVLDQSRNVFSTRGKFTTGIHHGSTGYWKSRDNGGGTQYVLEYSTSDTLADSNIKWRVYDSGITDQVGALRINSTTVIDSSRNLTAVAGSFSGRIIGTDNTYAGGIWLSPSSGTSYISANRATDTTGQVGFGWYSGASMRWVNYLPQDNNNILHWYSGTTSTNVMTLDNSGNLNLTSGALRINGTTVIDSSRNLTNINAGAFGQDVSAMDTTNLDIESAGHMSIRGGSYLYFGITSNSQNSWKNRITGFNTSTLHINAQGIQIDNTGYASPAVSWLTANNSTFSHKGNTIWHAGNDGSGSGLDADTLDGLNSSQFLRSDTNDTTSGYLEAEGFAGTGSVLRLSHPRDATYHISSSSVTGAIKVTLPVSWTNTMMRMTIKVYDYAGSESFEVMCGGYNYSPSTQWINTFAYLLCDPSVDRDFSVRFGHDGSKCAIYIGETNSTWSYLKVGVTEFEAGHSNYDAETWNDGWDISLVTSFGTITRTESNPQIGKYVAGNTVWHAGNDGSGSGLDADTLDGVQGASYLRSDADDTYSGNLTVNGMIFKSDSNTTRNFKIQGPSGNDVGISGFTSGGSHAFQLYGTSSSQYGFLDGNWASWDIRKTKSGNFEVDEGSGLQRVWNAGNDGSGSGLDADLWDGNQFSSYLNQAVKSDSNPTFNNVYSNEWFRNNSAAEGLYNESTSSHFYSAGSSYWHINPSSAAVAGGLIFYGAYNATQGNSTNRKGYVYWDSSGFGLLSSDGSWAYRHNNTYADIYGIPRQDGTNTMWHAGNDGSGSGLDADTLDGSQLSAIKTNSATDSNQVYIRNASPTVYLRDTDHISSMIHQNSDRFYILRADAADDTGWTAHASGAANNAAGRWPLEMNISDSGNYVSFASSNLSAGGYSVWHTGNDGSGSGLDADTLDGVNSTSFARSDAGTTYSNYGNLQRFYSNTNLATASGSQSSLECFSNGAGNDAFMTFHVGSDYAVYFGLDGGTNDLAVGGWSLGANSYKVWHAANDGSGSGLDADNLDGVTWGSYKSTGHTNVNLQASNAYGIRFWNGNDQYKIFMSSQGGSGAGRQGFEPNSDYNMYFRMDGGTNRGFVFQDGAGNNKAGIDAGGNIRADGIISSNNKQAMNCAHWSASGTSTGAIKITLPGTTSNFSMPVIEVTTYDYSSKAHVIYNISGHNWSTTSYWYNTRVTSEGGPPLTVRLGHDGTTHCIIIGETNTSWSYGSVTVALKVHPAHYASNQNFTTGWSASQITSLPSTVTAVTVGKIWHSTNDGSGSGLDADSLDGMNASTSVANSTIVARDSNSYIYASHINFSTNESENPSINSFITSNGDGWSRKSTVDHVRAAVTANNVYNNLRTSTGSGANLNSTFLNDRSGTFDCWSGSNFPPSTTHVQGLQVRHSTSTDYGWQLASQYNQPGKMYLRHVSNGTFYDWHTMWSSQNDGSGSGLDADLLDGYHSAENGASVNLRTGSNGYLYLDNWIRTGNSTGIYTNDGGYFYRAGAYWIQRGNSNNSVGTRYQTTDGTNRGYVYADNANQVGFLNNSANWVLKVQAAGSVYLGGTQQMRINSSSTTGILESTATNLVLRSSGGGVISLQNSSAAAIAEYTDAGNYSNVDGHTTLKRTANAPLIVDRLGTTGTSGTFNGEILNFRTAGTKRGEIGYKAFAYGDSPYFATYDWGLGFFSFSSSRYIQPCDGDGAIRDNQVDLGSTSARFDDVYATNGTIQTSDRNEKQDIQALTDAETRVATACKGLIRRYRWISSVEEKGDDARYHFGAIAQDVEAAFTAEGLDARNYGLFIRTTWWEHEGENYPAAEVAPTGAVEKTRLGIRYNQLLAFIISAL